MIYLIDKIKLNRQKGEKSTEKKSYSYNHYYSVYYYLKGIMFSIVYFIELTNYFAVL